MRRPTFALAAVGVIGLGVWAVRPGGLLAPPEASPGPPSPVMDCPAVVDVGERETGSVAIARFEVVNRGSHELVLSDVRTACSCTGLERERDGVFYAATEVRVPPGGSVPLAIRQGVTAPAGGPMDSFVYFRTNDPASPERGVRVLVPRVTGGVEPSPRAVVCGTVCMGDGVRHVVELSDAAGRAVERVVSSDPARVRARVLPPAPGESLAGRVEVVVDTSTAGRVDGRVEVHSAGRLAPVVVPVSGVVVAPVELSPRTVVLPRRSEGVATYSAVVVCRSARGESVVPRVDACPADVTVSVGPGAGPTRLLTVTWRPGRTSGPAARVVRLTADSGGVAHALELVVQCQRPAGSEPE